MGVLSLALTFALTIAVAAQSPLPPDWKPVGPSAPAILADGTNVLGYIYDDAASATSGLAFLGVPFADSPVGELRWRLPVPWSGGGNGVTINATSFAPGCAQLDPATASIAEDCLFLNVFTPAAAGTRGASLPVMAFIYGGSFNSGATSLSFYNGLPLATRESVVVVTIAYRVGPFGFIALPELAVESGLDTAGNMGIADQRLGLAWIQQNIASFGGNPAEVTLFGESAGAISVCVHLVSPHSQGLFARALMESGDCNFTIPLEAAYAQGAEFAAALGCAGSDANTLTCLRAQSVERVLRALPLGGVGVASGASYGPVVDGYELTAAPNVLIAADTLPGPLVPTLLGTNAQEATLFVMANATLVGMNASLLATLVGTEFPVALVPTILAQYPLSLFTIAPPAQAWAAILSDVIFRCPTWFTARATAALANTTVYRYDFTYQPQCGLFPPSMAPLVGVYHFAEIPYVFGVPPSTCSFTKDDLAVSANFQAMWGAWARGRAPASGWPAYETGSRLNAVIGRHLGVAVDYDVTNCEFWLEVAALIGDDALASVRARLAASVRHA